MRIRGSRGILRLASNSTYRSEYGLEVAKGFHLVPIPRRKLILSHSLMMLNLSLESLYAVSLHPSIQLPYAPFVLENKAKLMFQILRD